MQIGALEGIVHFQFPSAILHRRKVSSRNAATRSAAMSIWIWNSSVACPELGIAVEIGSQACRSKHWHIRWIRIGEIFYLQPPSKSSLMVCPTQPLREDQVFIFVKVSRQLRYRHQIHSAATVGTSLINWKNKSCNPKHTIVNLVYIIWTQNCCLRIQHHHANATGAWGYQCKCKRSTNAQRTDTSGAS